MQQKDMLFWIWLAECLGAENRNFRLLMKLYDNPYELFYAEEFELERIDGLSQKTLSVLSERNLTRATEILADCERLGITVLPYGSPSYPRALRELKDPPVVLYCIGETELLNDRLCIGMVGTRRMSEYGLRSAYKLSYELAQAGAIVVSGMAAGVDGVCAAAALAAKGTTVAVLGCGLDVVYPKHHKRLMDEIRARGVLISEYPPHTPPNHYHFPTRNRLISGLSQGTVVVEAGIGSGSLITAKNAILQGRDVFTVPANVGSPGAEGTNGLLRDGATPVLQTSDILDRYRILFADVLKTRREIETKTVSNEELSYLAELGVIELVKRREPSAAEAHTERPAVPKKRTTKKKKTENADVKDSKPQSDAAIPQSPRQTPDELLSSLTPIQVAILKAIPDDRAVTVDALGGLGYPYGDLIAALTMLEILGLIQKLPGALYTKT